MRTSTTIVMPLRAGLIVGEAPGPGQAPGSTFTGPSGERLSRLLGDEWHRVLDGVNLLDHQPLGRGGSEFDLGAARAAASILRRTSPYFRDERLVIFAGKRVARAFGWTFGYFELDAILTGQRLCRAVAVPHPSGRNRWWNDPANARRAAKYFKEILR